jgi:hypothetical protein
MRIERCGISTFQIAQSLATVASFAIGNTASGKNDREWSRPEFRPIRRGNALPHFLPGKLRAVRPRVKTLARGEDSFAPI